MIPNEFRYHRPDSLVTAIGLLQALGDGTKLLAGGHSLLPSMKLRLATPQTLIDINHLAELRGIAVRGDEVVIGATTTHAAIEHSPILAEYAPLLPRVAAQIADPTVRNRGTLGGSLANGDPSADWPAAMICADATFDLAGSQGRRSVRAEQFFKGLFETALAADELIVAVRIPVHRTARAAYRKFRHPASGYAVVGIAVLLHTDGGVCLHGRLAATGLADRALRLQSAESRLPGYELGRGRTDAIVAEAFKAVTPLEDSFADAAYRLQLARTMLRRALADAAGPVAVA